MLEPSCLTCRECLTYHARILNIFKNKHHVIIRRSLLHAYPTSWSSTTRVYVIKSCGLIPNFAVDNFPQAVVSRTFEIIDTNDSSVCGCALWFRFLIWCSIFCLYGWMRSMVKNATCHDRAPYDGLSNCNEYENTIEKSAGVTILDARFKIRRHGNCSWTL